MQGGQRAGLVDKLVDKPEESILTLQMATYRWQLTDGKCGKGKRWLGRCAGGHRAITTVPKCPFLFTSVAQRD